jgi:phosphoglycolate phosphatase
MASPLSLIFDLDGTLVDTAPDLLAALNAVLRVAGHAQVRPADMRHLVGRGARQMFEAAFAETGTARSAEELERYTDLFLAHYRANLANASRPFDGVPETLMALKRSGANLGVCTNKPHDLTEMLLDQLDLTPYFGAIQGTGVKPYNKPDARAVLDVIAALGGSRDAAVMIGDSPTDVAAARAAEIPVIAVSFGYTPVPPAELGADLLIHDFTKLPEALARIMG